MIHPPITEFITALMKSGYHFAVEGTKLVVSHPSTYLDDASRQFIRQNKESIIQALQEAPGPDIAKLVSGWPKHLRCEYAGRVGRYSNTVNLEAAMARAFNELKDYPQGG